jgi:hypothetical protein
VDAFVNPQLAERFRRQPATNADLEELARTVVVKPPAPDFEEPSVESLNLSWLDIDKPLGSEEPEPDAEASAPQEAGDDQAEEPTA